MDCLRTMRSPSEKTKKTGLCGQCRMKIEKENEVKEMNGIRMKPKGRSKAEFTAIEKFEESLKNNPEYHKFINMFRDTEKPNVRSV